VKQFHDFELAWAAGFVEGEAYIGLKNGRRRKDGTRPAVGLNLVVSQNERGRLVRLQKAVGGGGSIGGPYGKSYRWGVSCVSAIEVLDLLWPHLGPEFRKRTKKLEVQYGR
jgi:hypothetical protein